MTSACTDLDSLSIRVTRLDAQLEVASRRTAAVENMVANAEQWLERRLQDYGDHLLASWQEHLEARVAKTIAMSLQSVSSGGDLPSCQLVEDSDRSHHVNDEHEQVLCKSMNFGESSSRPQLRKRPAKRIRRPLASKATKGAVDKPTDQEPAQASAPSRASESSGVSASQESDTHPVKRLAQARLPSAPGEGSALKQVRIHCDDLGAEITGLLATPPEGVVTRALAVLLTSSSGGLTQDHATMLAQLPELGIAILRCSEEALRRCPNPVTDCISTMVQWCPDMRSQSCFPTAIVIDGASVDMSIRAALASNVITGIAVMKGSRHAAQSCCNAVNSAGVHLLLPERLEDLTAWLSKLPQLAQLS